MLGLFLTLWISAPGLADSLILVSGEGKDLDAVPRVILTALEESGMSPKGGEEMRSLELSSLLCRREQSGKTECSFRLKGEESERPVKDPSPLLEALRQLSASPAGLAIGSCAKDGSCEFGLGGVSCMVNLRLGEETPGKYGCGLVAI